MLRVISYNLGPDFEKIDANQLMPNRRKCAICGAMINGVAYLDKRNGNPNNPIVLCEYDAMDSMQPQQQQEKQQQPGIGQAPIQGQPEPTAELQI